MKGEGHMAKKSIIASAAAATLIVGKRNLRMQVSQSIRKMYSKINRNQSNQTEGKNKIGHPHPYDFEDNKMVGEGALTSIQYYNKAQQKSHR
jgi:hypothetical protein